MSLLSYNIAHYIICQCGKRNSDVQCGTRQFIFFLLKLGGKYLFNDVKVPFLIFHLIFINRSTAF